MASWYAIRARATGAEVAIYGEIGADGVSAKGFLEELGALPGEAPLDVRINSPGGSIFDAVAIHNALKRHAGPVTVWIDGIAASAASYVAMAGDEIVMPGNAFLMIHDPWGLVLGTAEDMRAVAGQLERIKAAMVSGYAAKSGRTEEEIAAWMAAETWFDAGEAVAQGFADRLAEPVAIAARFDMRRFRNAPPVLREAAAPEGTAEQDTAPAAAKGPSPPSPAPSGSPGDPDAARSEALAYARAVLDLCALAGQPARAARFLAEEADLDTVRASLLAARSDGAAGISTLHPQPGREAGAAPWGEVIARTFKLKG